MLIECLVCSTLLHPTVTTSDLTKLDGTIRVVFATTALGIGVNFASITIFKRLDAVDNKLVLQYSGLLQMLQGGKVCDTA